MQPPRRLPRRSILAALLCLASFLFVGPAILPVARARRSPPRLAAVLTPGSPLDPTGALARMDPERGPLDAADRLDAARELKLTFSQARRMQRLLPSAPPRSLEEFASARHDMDSFLSPEQTAKIDAAFDGVVARRLAFAEKVLPPGEFAKFRAKVDAKVGATRRGESGARRSP